MLTRWSTVSSFSLHSRHLLPLAVLSILVLMALVSSAWSCAAMVLVLFFSSSFVHQFICYHSPLFPRCLWGTDHAALYLTIFLFWCLFFACGIAFWFLALLVSLLWQFPSDNFLYCFWCSHWVLAFLFPQSILLEAVLVYQFILANRVCPHHFDDAEHG